MVIANEVLDFLHQTREILRFEYFPRHCPNLCALRNISNGEYSNAMNCGWSYPAPNSFVKKFYHLAGFISGLSNTVGNDLNHSSPRLPGINKPKAYLTASIA